MVPKMPQIGSNNNLHNRSLEEIKEVPKRMIRIKKTTKRSPTKKLAEEDMGAEANIKFYTDRENEFKDHPINKAIKVFNEGINLIRSARPGENFMERLSFAKKLGVSVPNSMSDKEKLIKHCDSKEFKFMVS